MRGVVLPLHADLAGHPAESVDQYLAVEALG